MLTNPTTIIVQNASYPAGKREVGDVELVSFFVKSRTSSDASYQEAVPSDVVVIVEPPSGGAPLVYATTRPDAVNHPGLFEAKVPLTESGTWIGRTVATGSGHDAVEAFFVIVRARAFPVTGYETDPNGNSPIVVTGGFPVSWTQPAWRIDAVAGNDANVGDDAHPLKTPGEYYKRVGIRHDYDRDITMTIVGDLSGPLNLAGVHLVSGLASGKLFRVVGVPSAPVASGNVVVRAFNQSANIPHGLTGNFGAHVRIGRVVRKSAGNRDSAWIAKDEGGIARMTYPAFPGTFQEQEGSWLTGDSFDFLDLPKVTSVLLGLGADQAVHCRDLHFTDYPLLGGQHYFSSCAFDNWLPTGGYQPLSNCQFGTIFSQQLGTESYITYGLMLGSIIANEGRIAVGNYTLLQGTTTYAPNYVNEGVGAGISCHTRGFGVYDSPGSGIIIPHGQLHYCNGAIYGLGNAGYGVEIQRGGKWHLDPTGGGPTVQGALGELAVGKDLNGNPRVAGPARLTAQPWGWTNDDRAYTFANLAKSIAEGGFGGNIVDPSNPGATFIASGD